MRRREPDDSRHASRQLRPCQCRGDDALASDALQTDRAKLRRLSCGSIVLQVEDRASYAVSLGFHTELPISWKTP